jgi:ribosomal protein S18 acetylase RimI-like enzyme
MSRSWQRSVVIGRPAGRQKGFERLLTGPDSFMLIGELDGSPMGYAVVDVRERADNWRIRGDQYADLESITVLPEARGRGIGTALMRQVYGRPRALDIREITTQVVIGNEEARRFCEGKGLRAWTINYLGPVAD